MCFNQQTPEVTSVTPPPPVKPLQITQRSTMPQRSVEPDKTEPVKYGSKTSRAPKTLKNDAASLLVPMSESGNKPGGLNA
tara:strand:+ start:775 stop:1014 length:240 start_codon:yes stop_codon:yes gene_type:complete